MLVDHHPRPRLHVVNPEIASRRRRDSKTGGGGTPHGVTPVVQSAVAVSGSENAELKARLQTSVHADSRNLVPLCRHSTGRRNHRRKRSGRSCTTSGSTYAGGSGVGSYSGVTVCR